MNETQKTTTTRSMDQSWSGLHTHGVLTFKIDGFQPKTEHTQVLCTTNCSGGSYAEAHTSFVFVYQGNIGKLWKIAHLNLSQDSQATYERPPSTTRRPFFSALMAVAARTTCPLVPPKPKELTDAQGKVLLGPGWCTSVQWWKQNDLHRKWALVVLKYYNVCQCLGN